MFQRARRWARAINRDGVAIWIAARDPRVPWYAKAVAAIVAAYAFSPIDLIPDFIPVLGYLDDVVIVPAGILLTVWLLPHGLMEEFRARAASRAGQPTSRAGAAGIVMVWIVALALGAAWLTDYVGNVIKDEGALRDPARDPERGADGRIVHRVRLASDVE